MKFLSIVPRARTLLFAALLCSTKLPTLPAAWDKELSPGAFSSEEIEALADIMEQLRVIGTRAYLIPGTLLYLYREHHSTYYNINAEGFREKGAIVKKKAGEVRIMMLGGSTVFGTSVADGQSIPAHLETLLRAVHPERQIEVYNLGIEGYTFQREFALAKHMAESLQPDLVVFYHGTNDARWAFNGEYGAFRPFEPGQESEFIAMQRAKGWTAAGAKVLNRVKRSWRQIGIKNIDELARAFVRHYITDVRSVNAHFERDGIEVLFLVQPTLETRGNRTPREEKLAKSVVKGRYASPFYGTFCRLLKAELEQERLPVVVLADALDDRPDEVYSDQVHMGPTGNRIMAEKILKVLQDRGWPRAASAKP